MSEENKLRAITNPYRAADAIRNWLRAYPEDIFPEISEEEWEAIHKVLDDAGFSMGRIAASCMRRVLNGLHGHLEPILKLVEEQASLDGDG